MQEIKISREKVVFVNLTEMDKYDGPEDDLIGGGAFIEQNGYGHEMFNFRNDNGKCYGYAPPWAKINLLRISSETNRDALGEYIDDVFVVFTCSRTSVGRIVCGFYQHARVYAEPVNDQRRTRKIDIDGKSIFMEYNMVCDASEAFLINRNDRVKLLPHSLRNRGIGHGQKSVWYVDTPERRDLKNDLLDYIESIINQSNTSDEFKYHLHNENKSYTTSTTQIYRSQAAKAECIRLKGCHCNICGFNFEQHYGELGRDYIEVHHITPIGKLSTAQGYEGTDPYRDLIPLCSNCHSIIHRRKEPYLPEEIKNILKKHSSGLLY